MNGLVSSEVLSAFTQFGLAGLILLVMVVLLWMNAKQRKEDNAVVTQLLEQYKKDMAVILDQYKSDVSDIRHLYENNAHLVKEYDASFKRLEALFGETLNVISLNTQTQTRLVDTIKNYHS